MTKPKFSLFRPIPALILYTSYIILLEILQLYIEESLGYAILIWLGAIFYIYLITYSFKLIYHASKNRISPGNAVINIAFSAASGVIFFAVNYFYIYEISHTNFQGNIGTTPFDIFISFLYFSSATFATVGYGDIAPMSSLAKILTILEILYSFFIIVIAFSGFSQLRESLKHTDGQIFNKNNKK